ETNNENYLDWEQFDDTGLQYESSFVTGYKIHTNGQRYFQANYAFVFLDDLTAESGAYMQSIFDFTTSGNSGKWSSLQQLYNPNLADRSVNHRRLKVRGKGKALQLRFV